MTRTLENYIYLLTFVLIRTPIVTFVIIANFKPTQREKKGGGEGEREMIDGDERWKEKRTKRYRESTER